MKKFLYVLLLIIIMVSCKDKTIETKTEPEPYTEEEIDAVISDCPENVSKIFEAHGGLDTWNDMETLEFSVEEPDGYEITTTDLKDRYALIEMPKYTIGYNGESLWVKDSGKETYEGNPESYYNLMFYLYAMPFILADDGTLYAEAEPIIFEGKTYSGIQVSFDIGVRASPNDEYILYYDADTYRMTWLAYKGTMNENEKSDAWQFINYSNWQDVEGLSLPETMVWYDVENNQPTTPEKEIKFVSPMLTTVKMDLRVYSMPEGAEMIQ